MQVQHTGVLMEVRLYRNHRSLSATIICHWRPSVRRVVPPHGLGKLSPTGAGTPERTGPHLRKMYAGAWGYSSD